MLWSHSPFCPLRGGCDITRAMPHSPALIYVWQWDIVVLDRHLVLLVLAALVICVGYICLLWCLTGTWCCECLLHLAYVLAICGYGGA